MKHRYPKISKSLVFKRTGQDKVEISDIFTEKKWSLNLEAAKFVKKLDGRTNPYNIPTGFSKEQINVLLRELYKRGLLQKSPVRKLSHGTFFVPLWEPDLTDFFRAAAFIMSSAALILFLPLLLVGILTFLFNFWHFEFTGAIWGVPLGLIAGFACHELGHICAAAAYGADVREVGVTLRYFVLPGIYTVMDDKGVKKRLRRIGIHATGVVMNLFLAGLFLILGSFLPKAGGMFLLAALLNAFLSIMHLMLFKSSDGAAILSEVLGVENIMTKAEAVVRSRDMRAVLMKQGAEGFVSIGISYVLFALQLVLPVLLILNVLEVIAWIV